MNITVEQAVKDSVCGMTVDPAKAAGQFDNKGQTYFFCSKTCLEKFRAEPEKYLKPISSSVTPKIGRAHV